MRVVYKRGSYFRHVWLEQDCDGYSAIIADYGDFDHPDVCYCGHECSPLFSMGRSCEDWVNQRIKGFSLANDEWQAHCAAMDAKAQAEAAQ